MKLLITLATAEPETAFNAFRLATFARRQGDAVSIFLIGKGVDIEQVQDARFDVRGEAAGFLDAGGAIQACGSCLTLRQTAGSEVCPLSTMQDLYGLIQASDQVVSF